MEKPSFFSNEYIVGVVLLFSGMYLQSEGRNVSSALFSLGAIVAFMIDLFKKVQHVQRLRQEIKVKVEKDSDKNKK
jgi:hypothetical protein